MLVRVHGTRYTVTSQAEKDKYEAFADMKPEDLELYTEKRGLRGNPTKRLRMKNERPAKKSILALVGATVMKQEQIPPPNPPPLPPPTPTPAPPSPPDEELE